MATAETMWLMPETIPVSPPGEIRFFIQPRWAGGPYQTIHDVCRRRDFAGFTELEVELPYPDGSVVAVVNLIPYYDRGVMVATSFGLMFQPFRRVLFGPADDAFRMRFWAQLQRDRPLLAEVCSNGLYLKLDDLALVHGLRPDDTNKQNLITSVDFERSVSDVGSQELFLRVVHVLGWSLKIFEEGQVPFAMDVSRPAQTSGDVLEAAGSAASWLFNNAGKIKDLIDLVDALTG